MLFSSFVFLFCFLPMTWFLYQVVARSLRDPARHLVLVVASLTFYGWFEWRYLLLIVPSILVNFAIGRLLCSGCGYRRVVLASGITLNLALIGFFKYTDFFIETINVLVGLELTLQRVVLPIGISFFTFQQIAYLVDCHRDHNGQSNLVRYALFVTFFPQLIAGPIVHHTQILPQFEDSSLRRLNRDRIAMGLVWFSVGMFKKVAIADSVAPWANAVFAPNGGTLEPATAWTGALAYTFQIYFDFSGYCDMAIGLGHLFNVRLPDNFDAPYRTTCIIDFWRRWHMTLSAFLRDYLYIPLGGNRRGRARRVTNLVITMLLGGLWHGAGWGFVLWGGLHGGFLLVNHTWRRIGIRLPRAISWLLTFLAVVVAWVFFRAASGACDPRADVALEGTGMAVAWRILRAMGGLSTSGSAPAALTVGWVHATVLGALLIWCLAASPTARYLADRTIGFWHACLYATLFFLALLLLRDVAMGADRYTEFIYFQF